MSERLPVKSIVITSLALLVLAVVGAFFIAGLENPQDINDSESVYGSIESFYYNTSILTNESLSIRFHECNYTDFKITLDEIECKDEETHESNSSIFIRIICEPHLRLTINYCYDGRESNVVTLHGEELIMDLKDKLDEAVKSLLEDEE